MIVTTLPVVTYNQVATLLREIVAEYGPDTTYEQRARALGQTHYEQGIGCVYRIDGNPACIIGVLLDRLGIEVPHHRNTFQITTFAREVMDIDSLTLSLMSSVQSAQDSGQSWGEALRKVGL